MNSNEQILTEEEALARIQRTMERLAKRGIVYTELTPATDDFATGESDLLGPTNELDYQRLLKELKELSEDGNDTDD